MSPHLFCIFFIRKETHFTLQNECVGSTIIGATNMTQLKINIDSINVKLPDELLAEIEDIHSSNPNPAP